MGAAASARHEPPPDDGAAEPHLVMTPDGHTPSPAVGSVATHLHDLVPKVSGLVSAMVDERPPQRANRKMPKWQHDAAVLLDALDVASRGLAELRDHLSEALAETIKFGTFLAFDGLPPMKYQSRSDRDEWAKEELADEIRKAILFEDAEAGVVRSAAEVYARWVSIVSILGYNLKRTGLRAMGIEADDYCRKTPRPAKIEIVRNPGETSA